jgi:hypothetical protein
MDMIVGIDCGCTCMQYIASTRPCLFVSTTTQVDMRYFSRIAAVQIGQ